MKVLCYGILRVNVHVLQLKWNQQEKISLYIKPIADKLHVASIKDDNVTLWEADGDGIPLIEGTGREYWSAFPALSPTDKFFAYADEDGNLKVWDVQSGNQLYELKHPLETNDNEDDETICDLQFSFDGKMLASESNYPFAHVISWDMELGEEIDNSLNDNAATRILGRLVLRHLKPRSREVVHISADGKYLASIGNNTYLYDVKENDYLTRLSLPQGVGRNVLGCWIFHVWEIFCSWDMVARRHGENGNLFMGG